jgi:hypothetical protein
VHTRRLLLATLFLAATLAACGGSGETDSQRTENAEIKQAIRAVMQRKGDSSPTIWGIEVDGSKATARVSTTGTEYDGHTLQYALVRQDDRWKVDRLNGFVKLDRAELVEQFQESLISTSDGIDVSQEELECIAGLVRAAPKRELETYLSDDPGPLPFRSQLIRCLL